MTFQTADDQSAQASSVIAPGPRARRQVLRTTQLGLILVGFAALIVATLASVALAQRNREAFELASHTQIVLSDTALSVELLEDAETGQRGFLLTEREAYLDPYRTAIGLVPAQLDRLVADTADLSIAGNAEKLRTAGLAKIDELKGTLDLYGQDGRAAALSRVMTNTGKTSMDEVREAAAAIRADQEHKLLERLNAAGDTGRVLIVAEIGTTILVIFIALFT